MYFQNSPHLIDVRAFFDGIKANIPPGVTLTFPNAQDTINDATGALTGGWTAGAVSNVVGTGTGTFIAAGGYLINWQTGSIVNNRRVTGHTFIVPGAGSTTNGVPTATEISTMVTASGSFLTNTAGDFMIWSRPAPGRAGSSHPVTGAIPLPYFTVLRSRRD